MARAPIRLRRDTEPLVSQVILLRGDVAACERCLRSLAATESPRVPVETILIVAPEPDVQAFVEQDVSGARLIQAEVDIGTAVGWNLAVGLSRARWIAIVHEDTEVTPGWQEALLTCAQAHPRAAIVGARMLNPDGSLQSRGWALWSDGRCACVDEASAPDLGTQTGALAVDLVSSACMLIEHSAWEDIGGFDERFFPAVGVEMDAALAVWARGRTVLSALDAVALHATAGMVRPGREAIDRQLREFLILRNLALLRDKWRPWLSDFPSAPRDDAELRGATAKRLAARAAQASAPHQQLSARALPPVARRITGDVGTLTDSRVPQVVETRALRARAALMEEFTTFLVRERDGGEEERRALAAALDVERDARAVAISQLTVLESEAALLRERSRTLDMVLSGRWWRLRGRIIRAARRLLRR